MSFLKYRRSVRRLEYVLLWCAYFQTADFLHFRTALYNVVKNFLTAVTSNSDRYVNGFSFNGTTA